MAGKLFLSHLSGDEDDGEFGSEVYSFLSHLSGDEGNALHLVSILSVSKSPER